MSKTKPRVSLKEPLPYKISKFFRRLRLYDRYLDRKHKHQRAKRGWADNDLFSLDYWFSLTFVDMLDNFQIRVHGHPQCDFEEVDTFEPEWIKEQLLIIKEQMLNYKYNVLTEEDIDEMINNMDSYIKWKLIIKRIIFYLNEGDEDKCSMKNEYFEQWYSDVFNYNLTNPYTPSEDNQDTTKLWMDRQQEIDEYRQECINKAFKLIAKYYYSLWD